MATRIECFVCEDADPPRARRFSLKALLKIAAAIAVAFVLIYAETWVIQQDPILSGAYAPESTAAASSDTDGPLRDTAGPVAVLH